jgi:uncharacterized membrane protein YfcA
MRTPVYGALLIVGAMVAATVVGAWTHPAAVVRDIVYVLCLVAAVVGLFMTLRDLSPPARKRRR